MISEKRRKHLEKLAEMKRGRPSPLKGRKRPPFSDSWKKKMSESQIKLYKNGYINHFKGRKHTEESKLKMTISRTGKKLTENHKQNLTKAGYKRWSHIKAKHNSYWRCQDKKLKEWRESVFERDNYICQLCGTRGGNLEAHHKKSWAKYPELRYKIENGITLCYGCHKKVDPLRR